MQVYWVAALIFGIVIALFAVQNSAPATIRFLWLSYEGVALSVLVMICASLGALVTLMFGLGREVRLQWSRRTARRTVQAHEKKIAELENAVAALTGEKAVMQARIADLEGTAGDVPRYEAVPAPASPAVGAGTDAPAVGTGPDQPSLSDGRRAGHGGSA